MSYKQNASANRDALFGPNPTSRNSKSKSRTSKSGSASTSMNNNRPSSSIGANRNPSTNTSASFHRNSPASSGSNNQTATSSSTTSSNTSKNRFKSSKSSFPIRTLSGAVKVQKMKEAEEYRAQAKKAMTRGIFTKPDPVIAGTYYKRAADIYKQCGENRLERLHRIASGDCQRGQEAYAIAASEYTRAAELVEISDEKDGRKRSESYQLNKNAADAWRNLNEMGRAGESLIKAAMGLLIGMDPASSNMEVDDVKAYGASVGNMPNKSLIALSEAIEAHVPDPMNRFRAMRKYGKSLYTPETNSPSSIKSMRELAHQNIVTTAYAHESVFKAVRVLVEFKEYTSALYGAGAVTALLEYENTATISLSRAYLNETILQLALNDTVAADNTFMEVHLQQNSYLRSRECKLAEDLIRAMKTMDYDALEACKLENRHALANLDPSLRDLVMDLQISGIRTRKKSNKPPEPPLQSTPPEVVKNNVNVAPSSMPQPPPPPPSRAAQTSQPKENLADDNFNEMMQIMNDMGLGDNEPNKGVVNERNVQSQIHEEIDDDEIDLR